MLEFQEAGYNKVKLQTLNHGRLSLQVTMLAKIVDHTGQHLLSEALFIEKPLPTLLKVSKSNYIWPNQPSPSHSMRKLWTKAICAIFTKP